MVQNRQERLRLFGAILDRSCQTHTHCSRRLARQEQRVVAPFGAGTLMEGNGPIREPRQSSASWGAFPFSLRGYSRRPYGSDGSRTGPPM
jgi:hypothetical protein